MAASSTDPSWANANLIPVPFPMALPSLSRVPISETGLRLLVIDKGKEVSFPLSSGLSSPVGHAIVDRQAITPIEIHLVIPLVSSRLGNSYEQSCDTPRHSPRDAGKASTPLGYCLCLSVQVLRLEGSLCWFIDASMCASYCQIILLLCFLILKCLMPVTLQAHVYGKELVRHAEVFMDGAAFVAEIYFNVPGPLLYIPPDLSKETLN